MIQSGDLAALIHCHLDLGYYAQTLIGIDKLLFPAVTQLHGIAFELGGQSCRDDLHGYSGLASKAATNVRGYHADIFVGLAQSFRKEMALSVGRLGRAPHGEPSGVIQFADGHVSFQGAMGIARHGVSIFQYQFRFSKGLFQIAFAGLAPMGDVGSGFGEKPWHMGIISQIRMQDHGIILQGFHLIQHGG